MLVPFFLDTVYIIILLHDVYVVLFVEHGVDGWPATSLNNRTGSIGLRPAQ